MNYSVLEQKILKTVCYFDLFNFPLTSWELYKNLYTAENEKIEDIFRASQNLLKIKALEFNQGFYFLPHRQETIISRKKHYLLAQVKMKIALRYARLLKNLPFVQAIFICNSLAYQNSKQNGDIDFAIIVKQNRIWTCRFFCAGLMALLHRRPTQQTQKNRICLSFFISESNLNLQKIAYPEDIHFTYWLKQFLPIYDRRDYIQQLAKANPWVDKILPNYTSTITNERWMIKNNFRVCYLLEKLFQTRLGGFFENYLKKFQLKIMPARLQELSQTENTDVVINSSILKFHDKDNRQEIKKNWTENYQKQYAKTN